MNTIYYYISLLLYNKFVVLLLHSLNCILYIFQYEKCNINDQIQIKLQELSVHKDYSRIKNQVQYDKHEY